MQAERSISEALPASNGTSAPGTDAAATRPHAAPAGTDPDSFCVIIPTLHEAGIIFETVSHARSFPDVAEVVVVDGGSGDGTVDRALLAGARVLRAPRGRGSQMNAGAHASRAPNLVFLHADCRLPRTAFTAMRSVFARGHQAGVFAIDYGSPHLLLRLVAALSSLRTPWTQFGEAALFVRREHFSAVGGFPDWPFFEDVEVLSRLRRRGKLGRADGRVLASPRRYEKRGVWRQQLLNLLLYTLFRFGIPPHRLLRLYEGGRLARRVPEKRGSA
ncbi:MAG: TIGR04283 family arsenosugar biosynthesis glycosyltransferase [Candidatus Krumholzibacteriia bacterium]